MYATTLEKKIRKFCKNFGITAVFATKEFSYIPEYKAVTFTIFRYEEDEELINYVNRVYNANIRPWFFIFCILHEIGHHMTLSQLSEEELINEQVIRKVIIPFTNNPEVYFTLPAEILATEWALRYLQNNSEKCWEFQRKCFKNIVHIYKKKSCPIKS